MLKVDELATKVLGPEDSLKRIFLAYAAIDIAIRHHRARRAS